MQHFLKGRSLTGYRYVYTYYSCWCSVQPVWKTCPLCISHQRCFPSGWADDVQVVVTDGTITKVTAGAAPGADDERHQLAIPE